MSRSVISLNPTLLDLRNQGFELEVREGHLVVHSIPYLNAQGEVKLGAFCCPLDLVSPDVVAPPATHVIHFIGEYPHKHNGERIAAIEYQAGPLSLTQTLTANFAFSNKPQGTTGFSSFYDKVWHYTRILWNEARAAAADVTPLTYKVVEAESPDSVFHYEDTASARYGTTALNGIFAPQRIAIVGLGGTGAYVLDAVAKTPVAEIHLYDLDKLQQHNAFRAPGAVSREALDAQHSKVDYFGQLYLAFRKHIVPHCINVTEVNVDELRDCDYVFLCVDKGDVRRLIYDRLADSKVVIIDTGIDVIRTEDNQLIGTARVTMSLPGKRDHVFDRISMADGNREALYKAAVQIAELNAINAQLAVLRWKRHCGFYYDSARELNATLTTASNKVVNSEQLP